MFFDILFFAVYMQEIATFQAGLNSEMTKKHCISCKICKSHIYEEISKK